jgi:hypothetical protein
MTTVHDHGREHNPQVASCLSRKLRGGQIKSIQDCHIWLRRVMRHRTASINVMELSFKAESMIFIFLVQAMYDLSVRDVYAT